VPSFDRILSSDVELPELRVRSLGELILAPRDGERDDAPVLMGCFDARMLEVSLRQLRHAVMALAGRLAHLGLRPGDTVCLVRLPRTSEVLCAVAYAAL
jgi:non-ribosomal peptide synthetase component E (peptide arylation enzyme)